MFKLSIFLFGLISLTSATTGTVSSYLSSSESSRLQNVFLAGFKSNDLQSIYYSAINLKIISDADKSMVCGKLSYTHQESKLNDFEKNFYYIGILKQLGCAESLPANLADSFTKLLTKELSTAQEVYYNWFSSKLTGLSFDEDIKTKMAANLQAILKKDDSLSSLGYAFHVAAELGNHAAFVHERIEDAIVQADEVDGKMLQFEGGLSITALIVNGALKLASSVNKPAPISSSQAVKFVTYFLTRSSVQTAKGASVLLEVLKTISKQKSIICIQLAGNGQLKPESPLVGVKVCDVLGEPLTPALATLLATITSKTSNTVLITKANLVPSRSDKTLFTYDLTALNPARGQYIVDIEANDYKQSLKVNILGKVKVSSLEIGVGDSDSSSAVKKHVVDYPKKLDVLLNADSQQKISLKIVLVDELSEKPITVHQSFVLLKNKESGEEIIFVAEQDASKAYKFEMDVGARGGDFGYKSGLYAIELIVGDVLVSNSFKWYMGDISLKFTQEIVKETSHLPRQPLPEIIHKFRVPEKRPPRLFSDLFTGLCLAPLLLLFIYWAKLRANISNFPYSVSALGFHLGLGAILGLFFIFWLQLNMFETIRYLLPLAILTFLCGNKLLRSIASKSNEK